MTREMTWVLKEHVLRISPMWYLQMTSKSRQMIGKYFKSNPAEDDGVRNRKYENEITILLRWAA